MVPDAVRSGGVRVKEFLRSDDTGAVAASETLAGARSNPDALLVAPRLPIDFTSGEETKFAEITAAYDFPCGYSGLTWLGARMADHPQVPRHYLQRGAARVTELLAQLQQEQANLTAGAPDLVARLQRLFQLAVLPQL